MNENQSTVDKSAQRVRQMFGEISQRYDLLNHVLSGGTDIYWRWRTVRRVRVENDLPVLDVCTGTGDLAFAWWKQSRGRVAVIGSDFTHEMLQIANDKKAPKPLDSESGQVPQFLEADTMHLPFSDGSFQIVSVAFGLRNVARTREGLSEMVRVCAPGGRVVILEFSLPGNQLFRRFYLWYFRTILPRIGQFFASNRQAAYNYLPESVSEFPYGAQLAGMLKESGLDDVEWIPLTFGIATLYIGRKPAAVS